MEEKVLLQQGITEFFKPLPKGKKWEPPPLPEPKRRKERIGYVRPATNSYWNSWMPWKTPSMIMKGVDDPDIT